MAAYLDMDDVLHGSEERVVESAVAVKLNGIERYCTDSRIIDVDFENTTSSKETKRLNKIAGKKPMKKKKSLHEIVPPVPNDGEVSDTDFVGVVETFAESDCPTYDDLIYQREDRQNESLWTRSCLKEVSQDNNWLQEACIPTDIFIRASTDEIINGLSKSPDMEYVYDLNSLYVGKESSNNCPDDRLISGGVPTPPSIDDAIFTMNQLESTITNSVAPIDILRLVDEWECDKVNKQHCKIIEYAKGERKIQTEYALGSSCNRGDKKGSVSLVNISVCLTPPSLAATSLRRNNVDLDIARSSPSPVSLYPVSPPINSNPNISLDFVSPCLVMVSKKSPPQKLSDVGKNLNISYQKLISDCKDPDETEFFCNARRLSSTPKCRQSQLELSQSQRVVESNNCNYAQIKLRDKNASDCIRAADINAGTLNSFEMNDDELLAGCLTPTIVCDGLGTTIERSTGVGQRSVTQLTFTQALACLHNDTDIDTTVRQSPLDKGSCASTRVSFLVAQDAPHLIQSSPKHRKRKPVDFKLVFDDSAADECDEPGSDGIRLMEGTMQMKNQEVLIAEKVVSVSETISKCPAVISDVLQPQFDLGFDLGFDDEDFEMDFPSSQLDDEIIPPSPTSATTSLPPSRRSTIESGLHLTESPSAASFFKSGLMTRNDDVQKKYSCSSSIVTSHFKFITAVSAEPVYTVARPIPSYLATEVVQSTSWSDLNSVARNAGVTGRKEDDCHRPRIYTAAKNFASKLVTNSFVSAPTIIPKSRHSRYVYSSLILSQFRQSSCIEKSIACDKPNFSLTIDDFNNGDEDNFHTIHRNIPTETHSAATDSVHNVSKNQLIWANDLECIDLVSPQKEEVYTQRVAVVQPTIRVVPFESPIVREKGKRDSSTLYDHCEG